MELPFTLTDFALAGKAGSVVLDRTPPFRPYSLQALQRDYPRPGRGGTGLEPFELSLDKVQSFFGLKLDVTLRSPESRTSRRPSGSGGSGSARMQLQDGTVIVPPWCRPDRGDTVEVGECDSLRRHAQGRNSSRPR